MKKIILSVLAACCLLVQGCSTGPAGAPPAGNVSVKISVEKDGEAIARVSTVASRNPITLSDCFQEKQENAATANTVFLFTGDDVQRLGAGSYSMNYHLSLKVPFVQPIPGKDSSYSIQYQDIGSMSSVNLELDKWVTIFENNSYAVKIVLEEVK